MALSRNGVFAAAAIGALLVATVIVARDRDPDVVAAGAGVPARAADQKKNEPPIDVRIELLGRGSEGAAVAEPGRDPFRFQPRHVEARPAVARPSRPAAVVLPPVPPAGPPPPPPIPLKFIGLVDAPTQAGRVAILSDGRGNIVYGREGDTMEGRYRLLKVGTDAVEMAYVDGRGRQTVRLAGQ